ncbi:MAG TPA: hypothetical protein VH253_19405 [Phycisphaerae bacterium]|nr:hypothetical protein [Phycisphaerae bacterium]
MTTAQVESRLLALEQEVARLKAQIAAAPNGTNWVESIAGTFANDPLFDEAMRLGRKWRQSEPYRAARSGPSTARAKRLRRK